jgi:NAD(P)-dependent dehydrogenase (short-subunit alcohol dehydrogenase family)
LASALDTAWLLAQIVEAGTDSMLAARHPTLRPAGARGSAAQYAPAMDLNGVAAIVSGGASGLGEATVRDLASVGCKVVVADLNEERGKSIADSVGGVFARTDVADEASVTEAVASADALGAPLRVAVSCAGIGWASRTVDRNGNPHNLDAYRKVIDVNLIGTFNVMRIAAAAIAKTDPVDADSQRGVVINTASVAGIEGQTGQVAYSASKGGIIGMTVPAARDLAAIGVRVNTICPGIIDTPIYGTGPGSDEFKAKLIAPVVFPKRMGTAAEFAQLVRSLIENDYMNAEVVRFDGGIRFQPK